MCCLKAKYILWCRMRRNGLPATRAYTNGCFVFRLPAIIRKYRRLSSSHSTPWKSKGA